MKRNRFKSLFALVAMVAIMLAPIFGHALVANANPTHPAIADNTSPRVLTVWKYAVDNLDEAGDRGDGTYVPNPAGVPFEGVTFRVVRVLPIGTASLTNPLLQVEGTHWQLDTTFAAMEVTTGANGSAVFNLGTGRSADGIYLVTELPSAYIVRPVDPFFVQMPQTRRDGTGELTTLLYDVHVQPKNVPFVSLDPKKAVDGGEYLSIMAGLNFNWQLYANVPNDLVHRVPEGIDTVIQSYIDASGNVARRNLNSGNAPHWPRIPGVMFELRDVLSPHLTLVTTPAAYAPVMHVTLDGGTTWLPLAAEHFTFSHVAASNTITFALTDLGMLHIDTLQTTPGPGRVDAQLRATFTTRVNPVQVPSAPGDETFNGIIDNTFGVYYIGPDWQLPPGTPPDGEYPDEDDHPIYAVGGLHLTKTNEDGSATLAGAEFHIAVSLADALEGRFLANNGNSYTAANLPSGVSFLVSTTNAEGRASFHGLPLHFAPGFDPETILPLPTNPPSLADTWIFRDFWLVETVAPSGFELLREPWQVTVTTNTHLDVNRVDHEEIPNRARTFLPFTGGMGTTILVLLAIAVIGTGTGALVYDKKRRRS